MGNIRNISWLIFLLANTCFGAVATPVFGDKELDIDGARWIWNNNSQQFSIAASSSMTESVDYIWPTADGNPAQTIITDGAGVLSFADVNAVAGVHKLLSITHTDAAGMDVTRGSLVYGNSTPKWDELTISSSIGSALTKILGTDGTDSGFRPIADFIDDIEVSIEHGNLAGLADDDHTQYFADTTIGIRANSYTTTGTITAGKAVVDNLTFDGSTISSADFIFINTPSGGQILIGQEDALQPEGIGIFAGSSTGGNNDGGGISIDTGAGNGTGVGGTLAFVVAEDGDFTLAVSGTGQITITGPIVHTGDYSITGDIDLDGTLDVSGESDFSTNASVNDAVKIHGSGEAGAARGAVIEWQKNGVEDVVGYLYSNSNSQLVGDTAKASSSTDTGNFWFGFDTGNCSLDQGNFTFVDGVFSITGSSTEVINSSSATTVLTIDATGLAENVDAVIINSNERGLRVNTTDERCIFGNTTTSTGVQGSATSGVGIDGTATTGLPGRFTIDSATTNTTLDVLEVRRRTTDAGFGANGIGGSICYRLENDAGTTQIAGVTDVVMTDVTNGAEVAEFRVRIRDGANGPVQKLSVDVDGLTIGSGQTGVDHILTFDGENSDQTITGKEDEDLLEVSTFLRDASADYRRYYHLGLASFDPGASGATWTSADGDTVGGWQLDNANEILESKVDVHADWDGASDLIMEVRFQINAVSAENETVDIQIILYYMGAGESSTKTQTIEVATNVGDGGAKAQYTMFQTEFPINYDEGGNVVDVGDCIAFQINLETDTSEVDDIILNAVTYYYNTTHVGIESGDT